MTQTANAATELAREHDEIDRLATRIATLAPGPERTALVHELCARFVIHVQVEERYLHPAVRTLLRNGAFAVTFQMRRNRAVGRTIACVERGVTEGDEYDILVSHLVVGVQDHVERQDAFLLPALVDVCPIEQMNRLGEQLREGIAAARRAVERATTRASERAETAESGGGG
ncbi:MAG TPA: hemerythrin domain-containing protein, partial [Actinospica sp.]|nr:hemerythrin domain-containing protein [Actinospica sp.]